MVGKYVFVRNLITGKFILQKFRQRVFFRSFTAFRYNMGMDAFQIFVQRYADNDNILYLRMLDQGRFNLFRINLKAPDMDNVGFPVYKI